MTVRSILYVPGDKPGWLEKSLGGISDAVIADLEDAVEPSAKPEARTFIASWLENASAIGGEHWVRINALGKEPSKVLFDDLDACVHSSLMGVCLAKFENVKQSELLCRALDEMEHLKGVPIGHTKVALLIESARGLRSIANMQAGQPRLSCLHLGEVDLAADVGMQRGPDESEFLPARWEIVCASRLLDLEPAVGPPSLDFQDLGSLRRSTERLRRLGFGGRAAIHPDQIPVINEVFTPTDEEVREAKDVIERFDLAASEGTGALVDAKGRLVDLAVVRSARRTLELASRR